jgi:hypothetical protein
MRTGKISLRAYLHAINKAETDQCQSLEFCRKIRNEYGLFWCLDQPTPAIKIVTKLDWHTWRHRSPATICVDFKIPLYLKSK